MTTLYRTVLIESAAQAEALPPGTVALEAGEQGQVIGASIRVRGGWHITGEDTVDGTPHLYKHGDMVGDQALVPIEAEEVRVIEHGLIELDAHGQEALYREPTPGSRDYRRTEYHTPWEEA